MASNSPLLMTPNVDNCCALVAAVCVKMPFDGSGADKFQH